MDIWILRHLHALKSGDESAKLIGVYSSEEKARAAQKRAANLPGFCDFPDAFEIDNYTLDRDNWTSGYVTV